MNAIQETRRSDPMEQHHVLLVEDEVNLAKGLAMVMREEGYDVDVSNTGRGALEKFGGNGFDLLVADLRLPDIDGMDVIQQVHEKRPSTKVVVITGYPSVSSAVQAVKMGTSDYFRKPFTDDEFMFSVKSVLAERESKIDGAAPCGGPEGETHSKRRGHPRSGKSLPGSRVLARAAGKQLRSVERISPLVRGQSRHPFGRPGMGAAKRRGVDQGTAHVHSRPAGEGSVVMDRAFEKR